MEKPLLNPQWNTVPSRLVGPVVSVCVGFEVLTVLGYEKGCLHEQQV